MGSVFICLCFGSVAQSCPTLPPHGLQHARPPCPSPAPGACSNSCPSSRWCHPTISSSVVPFSRLQSFPASGSFPMSQFFTSGAQSIETFSFNISPSNIYSRLTAFRIDWLDLFAVQGTLKSLLQHHLCLAGVREVISWPHFANEETETRKRKYLSQGHAESRKVKPGLNSTAWVQAQHPCQDQEGPQRCPALRCPPVSLRHLPPNPRVYREPAPMMYFPHDDLRYLKPPHWRWIPVLQPVQCWSPGSGQVVSKLRVFCFPRDTGLALSLALQAHKYSPSGLFPPSPFKIFWLCSTACGIFVPWPAVKPASPALKTWSLNHWTPREVASLAFKRVLFSLCLLSSGLSCLLAVLEFPASISIVF